MAVVSNKEKLLEATESILQKGANYCRVKLEEAKQANHHFADSYEDHSFAETSLNHSSGLRRRKEAGFSDADEATTPDDSDYSDYDDEELEMDPLD